MSELRFFKSASKKELPKQEGLNEVFKKLRSEKSLDKGEKYWFGISGSWRATSKEVEENVRKEVREILEHGGGIVSGGALNVDFFATDEAMKIDPNAVRIFLPVTLELYAAHYRKRAEEGVITSEQAEKLIEQLTKLKELSPDSLIENLDNTVVNKDTYFERNTEVANASDALSAFQVNDSAGVQDTLDKATAQGKPARLFKYKIDVK